MLWLVVLSICVILPLLVMAFTKTRGSQGPPVKKRRTMLYAPGSEDVAGETYFPARKDGSMPFPLGKKEERRKTETYRKYSED
jgi:hypothetical protein